MKPRKRLPKKRFIESDNKQNQYNPVRGSGRTFRMDKLDKNTNLPKHDIWYQKSYGKDNKIDRDNAVYSQYDLEAIASDFYRYILSPARAAKAQVSSLEDQSFFINSKRNSAGFNDYTKYLADMPHYKRLSELKQQLLNNGFIEDSYGDMWSRNEVSKELSEMKTEHFELLHTEPEYEECEKHLYEHHFTAKAGFWDLQMARRILSEGDGNFRNVGINHNGEVSTFDFDWTFYDIKAKHFRKGNLRYDNIRNKDIQEILDQAELELQDDLKALDRFYTCQLRTILLTDTKPLSVRHTESLSLQNEIQDLYLNNMSELNECLLSSKGFKKFINERLDFNVFKKDLEISFKHEKKLNGDVYNNLMNTMDMNYELLINKLIENDDKNKPMRSPSRK